MKYISVAKRKQKKYIPFTCPTKSKCGLRSKKKYLMVKDINVLPVTSSLIKENQWYELFI